MPFYFILIGLSVKSRVDFLQEKSQYYNKLIEENFENIEKINCSFIEIYNSGQNYVPYLKKTFTNILCI